MNGSIPSSKQTIFQILKKQVKIIVLAVGILSAPVSLAGGGQVLLHARSGLIIGSYEGIVAGLLDYVTLVDFEYENVMNNKYSYFIRSTFVFDIDKTLMAYRYVGGGTKYYFFSKGLSFDTEFKGTRVKVTPRFRFYMGVEFGLSQVLLRTVGSHLRIDSSTYDYGGNLGIIWNYTDKIAFEFSTTAQISTGFSSISTGGAVFKNFAGLVYHL